MLGDTHLEITASLRLPLAELEYRSSRSGGPGGQHVNTASTRVEVRWDVRQSPSLNQEQRALLLQALATRLDGAGRLRLVAAGSRSQFRNREEVTERLRRVVAEGLRVRKARRPTRRTRAAEAARLDSKRRRSAIKRQRRDRPDRDE